MQVIRLVREAMGGDSLRRNAAYLFGNTVLTSLIGFAFWVVAARLYPTESVGALSGLTAGCTLVSTVAAVGLPNTVIRYFGHSDRGRDLVLTAALAAGLLAAAVGAGLALVSRLLGTPHVTGGQTGATICLFVLVLGVLTAANVVDSTFVAARATHLMFVKNGAGSIAKLAALPILVTLGTTGLLGAYVAGVLTTAAFSLLLVRRRIPWRGRSWPDLALLRQSARFSLSNYAGTLFGVLPTTVVPLLVLSVLGSRQAAYFTVVFLIATFLNFIPSSTSQSLFAEIAHDSDAATALLVGALRSIYALLVPAAGAVVLGAPWILRVFGTEYARAGGASLRVLGVACLVAAGNYVVDTALMATGRMNSYIVVNAFNSLCVVGLCAAVVTHGLLPVAVAWLVAQTLSLVVAAVVLLGRYERHGVPDPVQA